MVALHLRQRIFAKRSETFSSAIEYLAAHAGQEIFTSGLASGAFDEERTFFVDVRSDSGCGVCGDEPGTAGSKRGPFLPSLSGFASAVFTLIRKVGPASLPQPWARGWP